jgi:hypothetical protein
MKLMIALITDYWRRLKSWLPNLHRTEITVEDWSEIQVSTRQQHACQAEISCGLGILWTFPLRQRQQTFSSNSSQAVPVLGFHELIIRSDECDVRASFTKLQLIHP